MNDNHEFKKLSFWQLLDKDRSVEIPIIQRDYAQGRKEKSEIRDSFLSALYDALSDTIELDFIFGREIKGTLQPLDGQQRLTTLFLLHWYVATKECCLDESVKKRLRKFTYETRTSSREFCNELVNNDLTIEKDKNISTLIKNTPWFVISWEKDPTIAAMLIMLDDIHSKFKVVPDIWGKLISDERPPITFLYIRLENFGLSDDLYDDLYIKMNARGKQLTPFENFKSRFEKHVEKKCWEHGIAADDSFSHQIDTIWTDLFWKYKEKIKKKDENGIAYEEYKIDKKLINFIAGVAINNYAQSLEIFDDKEDEEKIKKELEEKGKTKTITNDAIKRERIEKRIATLANSPEKVAPEDFSTEQSFKYLNNCLNMYARNDNEKIKPTILFWDFCDTTLFEDMISGQNMTQQKRVLFYAQTMYLLENNSVGKTKFDDWMRVIRNIVENAISGNWNIALMINLIQLVTELSGHSNDIYAYFADSATKLVSATAKDQIKEEIEKSKIFFANPNAKKIIHKTEDTNFCKGKIDFVLYCVDYDVANNPQPKEFNVENFEKMYNIITVHFDTDNEPELFRRAFLTIASNDYYNIWSWSGIFDLKRGYLRYQTEMKDFSQIKDWHREYLKELFIQLNDKQSFRKIIDDYVIPADMPKWKEKLIKQDDLLSSAMYILYDTEYCYLAFQQRPRWTEQLSARIE
jgi:hypothetical protein